MNVKRVSRIVSMLYDEMKILTDEGRDLPVRWNVMHMYSSSQLAKLIAIRRGMDIELASIAAALHDIAVVRTMKSKGHAEFAEEHVRNAIEKYNNGTWADLPQITKEEEDLLVNAIIKHSDKGTYSNDALAELLKDVDSIDRYLYGIKTEGPYLERCHRVMSELGITSEELNVT